MKILLALILAAVVTGIYADDHLEETRYCAAPKRDSEGKILRSMSTVRKFKELYPCVDPCDSTWQVDHVIPLSQGGCDSVSNMQWLPPSIKRCAGKACKDRWERIIYPNKFD